MDSITPLRRVRVEKLKMRQAEAAQIMGVAQTTVSRWERGEGEPFLSCVGALIAEAAKRGVTLTVEDFFDGEAAA